jgi:hypothetical protein
MGNDNDDDLDADYERANAQRANVNRAPICLSCGVTALPAHRSNVIDSEFVCDNDDCLAFGEPL